MNLLQQALIFATIVLLGCASPARLDAGPYPGPAEDCGCKFTLRPPQMDYFAFMRAGDLIVMRAAPQWYVSGSPDQPLIMHAMPNMEGNFGQAWKDEEGVFNIAFGRSALFLATIEDMAHVVLHEYVHVKIWDEIASHDEWSKECKMARHELVANKVVIEHYHKIGYTPHMYRNSRILYGLARAEAKKHECPAEVTLNMPMMPVPVPLNQSIIPYEPNFGTFEPPEDRSSLKEN